MLRQSLLQLSEHRSELFRARTILRASWDRYRALAPFLITLTLWSASDAIMMNSCNLVSLPLRLRRRVLFFLVDWQRWHALQVPFVIYCIHNIRTSHDQELIFCSSASHCAFMASMRCCSDNSFFLLHTHKQRENATTTKLNASQCKCSQAHEERNDAGGESAAAGLGASSIAPSCVIRRAFITDVTLRSISFSVCRAE